MKLIESKKIRLPKVFFISDRSKVSEVPAGVPFIYGDDYMEPYLVRILEHEVLYQEALKSGYPFNFKEILRDNGYLDIDECREVRSAKMEKSSEGIDEEDELTPMTTTMFRQFIKDTTAYVDITKLKALNVFPIWLDTIEDAVHTNIHNFAVFNPNMYNKKLDGMYGSLELVSPGKNLIIIDISGSIPRGVSSTCLALSKHLAETFYADVMITGSKTTLYSYENLGDLNIDTIYEENGMSNEGSMYQDLVSSDERYYQTAIVFGDHDRPEQYNIYNESSRKYARTLEDGIKVTKWRIGKLISFDTSTGKDTSNARTAGYGRWFNAKEVEHVGDWCKYL